MLIFHRERNGPTLMIDYIQYNFVNEPCRMALIDSSMFGVRLRATTIIKMAWEE